MEEAPHALVCGLVINLQYTNTSNIYPFLQQSFVPNFEFQPMADTTNSNPRNNFHQHVHIHQHVAQELGGIQQPVLDTYSYPNQAVIKQGKCMVDVVFVKDPTNFFCQFGENSPNLALFCATGVEVLLQAGKGMIINTDSQNSICYAHTKN